MDGNKTSESGTVIGVHKKLKTTTAAALEKYKFHALNGVKSTACKAKKL